MRLKKRAPSDEQLFPSLRGQGMIAIDVEGWDPELKTKGAGWHRDDTYVAGVAIGTEAGFRQYYPVEHDGPGNMDPDKVFAYLKDELRHGEPKVGAHLLYDIGYLGEYGVKLGGIPYDIQNAEPLLNENKFTYSLESLSKQYLGIGKIDGELDEWIASHINEKDAKRNPKRYIAKAPAHIVSPYAIGDVNHPLEIFKLQKPLLEQQRLWNLFILESKLIPLLHRMRRRAVAVNILRAEEMRDRLRREQEIARQEMRRIVGFDVEVWAPKSLQRAFDQLGIRYPLTPTGKPSFTKPIMEKFAQLDSAEGRFVDYILEDRRLDKMCGTFLEGCILDAHHNGRVYCNFNQQKSDDGGAVSGRFSSSMPNLQFIPERTEEGKLIRSIFEPDLGCTWGKPDYSQIEFRLMVADADDLKLPGAAEIVQQYHDDPDTDFHEVVTEIVYGDPAAKTEAQWDKLRKRGKTINFGIAFGEGEDKLSTQLGVSKEEGAQIIAEYHRKVRFMRKLAQSASDIASSVGEVETILGRIRRFPWGKTKWIDGVAHTTILPHRVPGAKRIFTHKALNARIQGSAADVMKKAMVDLDEDGVFDDSALGAPHLTVHDELDISFPETKFGIEAMLHVKDVMERAVSVAVPLRVDIAAGPNWGAASDEYWKRISA